MRDKTTMLLGTLAGMLLCCASGQARADEQGTYFALELEGGAAFALDYGDTSKPGYSARLAFGVGGKPAGWSTRFYFLAAYERTGGTLGGDYLSLDRSTDSLLLGPRVVFPLFAGLRLFGEVLIGPSWVCSDIDGPHPALSYKADETLFTYRLGIGLQYRIFKHLSVGVRAEYADEADDGQDLGARVVTGVDGDPGMRIGVSAFATVHF